MLHESLQLLADHLAKYRETGVALESEAVATFCVMLQASADQAAVLEEVADRYFQGHGLPPEVVRIATLLVRHGVSAGMPKASAGGAA